jgi:hypothetical protein
MRICWKIPLIKDILTSLYFLNIDLKDVSDQSIHTDIRNENFPRVFFNAAETMKMVSPYSGP